MKKPDRILVTVGVILVIGAFGLYRYRTISAPIPRDYTLPHDNFSKKTMDTIRADLAQYSVGSTPQDHEVYMITGGIGVANPRILSWDSIGNMTFGGNKGGDWEFREIAQPPSEWYMKTGDHGVGWTNGPAPGYKPVPWIIKYTSTGMPYYEWDTIPHQMTQYYFEKGDTYIVLRIDDLSMNQSTPTFPEGVMSHLVPLGNPVN